MTGGIPATQKFQLPFTATKETHHIILTMERNAQNDAVLWNNISLKEWHGFNSGIGDYKSSYEATDTFENFVTHSEFRPYVTQIGLYNDSEELVAQAIQDLESKDIKNPKQMYVDYLTEHYPEWKKDSLPQ